jgi:hypothetical protein
VLANNTFTFPPKVLQQIIPKCTRKKKTWYMFLDGWVGFSKLMRSLPYMKHA